MIAIVIAGLSLGILGSFHCVGMCGPIALALPVHHYAAFKKYLGISVYNLGRAFTYGLFGFIFGLLGQTFYFGGFQQMLSITLGVFILATIFLSYSRIGSSIKISFITTAINSLKNKLGKLFAKKGLHFLFLIGLLNGLLPCGFVYMAIAGAVATGGFANGALFMFFFGVGTIPVMVAISIFGQFITVKYRNAIHKSVPMFVSIMAILLIVRGLNLGIPFLSPQYKQEVVSINNVSNKHTVIKCCVPKKNNKEKSHSN